MSHQTEERCLTCGAEADEPCRLGSGATGDGHTSCGGEGEVVYEVVYGKVSMPFDTRSDMDAFARSLGSQGYDVRCQVRSA